MAIIETHRVPVNGIELHVAEAGSGPAVVLCHGFPELGYSWRHQLTALAEAGYRVLVPDMRGYGQSSVPTEVEAYDMPTLCGDLIGLLDAVGEERAVFVGHDWGAAIVWQLALAHPARVTGVVGMSVPFTPRSPVPPLGVLRERWGQDFYIVWFQHPGVADAALARDVRRTLTTQKIWGPQWCNEAEQPPRPKWLTESDLRVYVEAFAHTGFTGGLNYYRNLDRNWHLSAALAGSRVERPALFLTGSRDPVARFMPAAAMDGWVTDLRDTIVIDGAGHWVQQERPREVNDALLGFLAAVA